MSTNRQIDKICIAAFGLALFITFLFFQIKKTDVQAASAPIGYEAKIFDTIIMEDWDTFLENCTDEKYVDCTVIIDGDTFRNVAIRAKGNTSLSSVASYGNNRYSFKIEFDHYDNANTYYGLDKICLNNIIQDNTYMKDYLTYQLMLSYDVNAPLCSYTYITVNGEDWGLYLAVEAVEEAFLQRNYGYDYGNLYKPDSVTMGGGYSEMVEDGVQYRIAECDNVEKFADRQVYLCVNDGMFYNNDAYTYDEQSGAISRNEQYQGVNALFTLPLDKSKADKKAAEEYVKQIEDEWNGNGEAEEAEEETAASEAGNAISDETDATAQAAKESEHWKLEDFEKNTELVKEMELTADADGNYAYQYEISADGLASEGVLGKEELSDRDEENMAKCRRIMSGEDSQTAYIETFTLKEDGNVVLQVYKYRK